MPATTTSTSSGTRSRAIASSSPTGSTGIGAIGGVGGSYPIGGGGAAPALPGAVMQAVDTAVLDQALLQQTTVYQLLKTGGGEALQVLKGVPPALGQHLDVSV